MSLTLVEEVRHYGEEIRSGKHFLPGHVARVLLAAATEIETLHKITNGEAEEITRLHKTLSLVMEERNYSEAADAIVWLRTELLKNEHHKCSACAEKVRKLETYGY